MKGRIIEINGDTAIVFTKSGTFVKTKNFQGASVGDEISLRSPWAVYSKAIVSAAAAFMLIAGGITSYCTPVSYVDICINPEIELGINMFDIVVSAEPKNDDGIAILAQNKVNNKKVEKAIDSILSDAENLGFISENEEKTVVMSVFAKNENNAKETYENINSYKVPEKINKVVKLASTDELTEAKEENIPVGKYLLVNELSEIAADIPKEEIKKYPVKKIITAIDKVKSNSEKPVDEKNAAPEVTQKSEVESIVPSSAPQEIINDIPVMDYFKDKPAKNNNKSIAKRAGNTVKNNIDLKFKTPEPVSEDIPVAPPADIVTDNTLKTNDIPATTPSDTPEPDSVNVSVPEQKNDKQETSKNTNDEPDFRPSWDNQSGSNNKSDNDQKPENSDNINHIQFPHRPDIENNHQYIPETPEQKVPSDSADSNQNITESPKKPDNYNPTPDYPEKESAENNHPRNDFENISPGHDNQPSDRYDDTSDTNDNPQSSYNDNSPTGDNSWGGFGGNSHENDNSRGDHKDNSPVDDNFRDSFDDNSPANDNFGGAFEDSPHKDNNDSHDRHGDKTPDNAPSDEHSQGSFDPR